MIDSAMLTRPNNSKSRWVFVLTFASRLPVAKRPLFGVIVESHPWWKAIRASRAGEPLAYGKSITDACIGWEDTDALLRDCRMQ
ncbi:hypothetical protein ACNKHT_03680 [Shigella flexneri]